MREKDRPRPRQRIALARTRINYIGAVKWRTQRTAKTPGVVTTDISSVSHAGDRAASQRSTRALFLHTLLWFVVGALFVGGVFSYLGDSLYCSGIPDLLKMAFVVLVVGVGFAPLYRHFPWVFGGIGIIAAEADFRAPDLYRPVPETAATLRTVLERTRATGADIREGSGEALYVPSDFISMPAFQAFKGADYFYNVAFHELTHWTGHKSRLDRDLKTRFGRAPTPPKNWWLNLGPPSCRQNLALTATFAGYIATWIELLKADKRAFFTACSKASKAADYLRDLALAEPATTAA